VGLFNEILAPRYLQRLQKQFGLKGSQRIQLAPEIQPVVIVEDDRLENRFLGRERLWANRLPQAGTGVLIARYQIQNPATSRVLVVVTELSVIGGAAAQKFEVRLGGVLLAGAGPTLYREGRLQQDAFTLRTQCQFVTTQTAASTGLIVDTLANVPLVRDFSETVYILAPGQVLELAGVNAIAQTEDFSSSGYERDLEQAELT
jgi:hypothetical protein